MGTISARINFALKPHQQAVRDCPKRHRAVVMHRRAGKTLLAVFLCLEAMLTCERRSPRIWYISPYLKQSKKLAWDYFRNIVQAANSRHFRVNNSELSITFLPRDARVTLAGADNTDALRGIYADFAVVDEMADCDPRLWTNVLRPALSDRLGRALIAGTPRGRGNFLYDLSMIEADDPEWEFFKYDCYQTGMLSPAEIEATRRDMIRGNSSYGEALFKQELECSFNAALIGAIYGREMDRLENDGRVATVEYDPSFPVSTAWDLGYADATAVIFVQNFGSEVRLIDYEEFTFTALPEVCKRVLAKGYVFDEHFAPHDIRVREYSSGRSRLEVARDLGIDFTIAPNWSVEEGIACVQRLLGRLWINQKQCIRALECLTQYRFDYDDDRRAFKVIPRHDHTSHCCDAFRVFATAKEEALPLGKGRKSQWLV